MTRNPKGVQKGFNDQYESMMQVMGVPMMQAAMPIMKSVTDMFTKLGAFANTNPETIKTIGTVLAALSVGLVAIGGIAIASLVAVPAAIAGVAAAIAAFCGTKQ